MPFSDARYCQSSSDWTGGISLLQRSFSRLVLTQRSVWMQWKRSLKLWRLQLLLLRVKVWKFLRALFLGSPIVRQRKLPLLAWRTRFGTAYLIRGAWPNAFRRMCCLLRLFTAIGFPWFHWRRRCTEWRAARSCSSTIATRASSLSRSSMCTRTFIVWFSVRTKGLRHTIHLFSDWSTFTCSAIVWITSLASMDSFLF